MSVCWVRSSRAALFILFLFPCLSLAAVFRAGFLRWASTSVIWFGRILVSGMAELHLGNLGYPSVCPFWLAGVRFCAAIGVLPTRLDPGSVEMLCFQEIDSSSRVIACRIGTPFSVYGALSRCCIYGRFTRLLTGGVSFKE